MGVINLSDPVYGDLGSAVFIDGASVLKVESRDHAVTELVDQHFQRYLVVGNVPGTNFDYSSYSNLASLDDAEVVATDFESSGLEVAIFDLVDRIVVYTSP